ncbi:MAG: DUF3667 domain-containing protein [Candidatus Azotimanducaceae bacterium WSBS_2022_MAG_OTU7]
MTDEALIRENVPTETVPRGQLQDRLGLLTTEYFEGRRARCSPPIRLYLVISFLFFFITPSSSFSSLRWYTFYLPHRDWPQRLALRYLPNEF